MFTFNGRTEAAYLWVSQILSARLLARSFFGASSTTYLTGEGRSQKSLPLFYLVFLLHLHQFADPPLPYGDSKNWIT